MKPTGFILIIMCLLLSSSFPASAQTERVYSDEKISAILDAYKKDYPGPIVFSNIPATTSVTALPTNETRALLYPNQDRATIQQTHERAMQALLIDNRTTVMNAPNQDRPSIEETISRRVTRTE